MHYRVTLLTTLALLSLFNFNSPACAFTLAAIDSGWSSSEVIIDVNLNDCPASMTLSIERAMNLWSFVSTSSLNVKLGDAVSTTVSSVVAQTTAGRAVIICDPNFGTTFPDDDHNYIGGGSKVFANHGSLVYGWFVVNVQSGSGGNMKNRSQTEMDILVTHEMGHVLGLGHSASSSALMYYTLEGKSELRLSQDDEDGISYLYPRNELSKDKAFGCGLIQNKYPPTHKGLFMSLLFLPFTLAIIIRRSRWARTQPSILS